jgi:hypothetical protein
MYRTKTIIKNAHRVVLFCRIATRIVWKTPAVETSTTTLTTNANINNKQFKLTLITATQN